MLGEIVQPSAPMKKTMARSMMLCRRPYLSESLPPTEAPSAAPRQSRPPIQPSSQEVICRPSAPCGRYM